jgi:chromatin remodeling complex protein RSC6
MWPSPALAQIVGPGPLTPRKVVAKFWAHVQAHQLQDEAQRRLIHADALLLDVLGGAKTVTMLEMTGLLNRNLRSSAAIPLAIGSRARTRAPTSAARAE